MYSWVLVGSGRLARSLKRNDLGSGIYLEHSQASTARALAYKLDIYSDASKRGACVSWMAHLAAVTSIILARIVSTNGGSADSVPRLRVPQSTVI